MYTEMGLGVLEQAACLASRCVCCPAAPPAALGLPRSSPRLLLQPIQHLKQHPLVEALRLGHLRTALREAAEQVNGRGC